MTHDPKLAPLFPLTPERVAQFALGCNDALMGVICTLAATNQILMPLLQGDFERRVKLFADTAPARALAVQLVLDRLPEVSRLILECRQMMAPPPSDRQGGQAFDA